MAAALDAWGTAEDWLVLGGGSNVVIADEGFDGTVVRVATRGIERLADETGPHPVRLRVEAGEPWDDVVAYAVEQGLGGIEALSGIPGTTGAAPIQNIGAYGEQLSETLVAIDFLDAESGEVSRLDASELELGYRTSALKLGAPRRRARDRARVPAGRTDSPRRSPTTSSRRPSVSRSAIECRSPMSAPPCSRCAPRRGWCWTRPTPTR